MHSKHSKHSKHPGTESAQRRHARLPTWVLIVAVGLLAASFTSGIVIWWGQWTNANFDSTAGGELFPLAGWVKVHGMLNPFLCGLLGYLTHQHIRVGWRTRANLTSGVAMVVVFGGLILSGTTLAYAESESTREVVVWIHRGLGLLLPLGLAAHWIQAWNWIRKL